MPEFTPGEWEIQEYVPEGITLNGKEYAIYSTQEEAPLALVVSEADARLIAAAPEMYALLKLVKDYKTDTIWDVQYRARQILARIDDKLLEIEN